MWRDQFAVARMALSAVESMVHSIAKIDTFSELEPTEIIETFQSWVAKGGENPCCLLDRFQLLKQLHTQVLEAAVSHRNILEPDLRMELERSIETFETSLYDFIGMLKAVFVAVMAIAGDASVEKEVRLHTVDAYIATFGAFMNNNEGEPAGLCIRLLSGVRYIGDQAKAKSFAQVVMLCLQLKRLHLLSFETSTELDLSQFGPGTTKFQTLEELRRTDFAWAFSADAPQPQVPGVAGAAPAAGNAIVAYHPGNAAIVPYQQGHNVAGAAPGPAAAAPGPSSGFPEPFFTKVENVKTFVLARQEQAKRARAVQPHRENYIVEFVASSGLHTKCYTEGGGVFYWPAALCMPDSAGATHVNKDDLTFSWLMSPVDSRLEVLRRHIAGVGMGKGISLTHSAYALTDQQHGAHLRTGLDIVRKLGDVRIQSCKLALSLIGADNLNSDIPSEVAANELAQTRAVAKLAFDEVPTEVMDGAIAHFLAEGGSSVLGSRLKPYVQVWRDSQMIFNSLIEVVETQMKHRYGVAVSTSANRLDSMYYRDFMDICHPVIDTAKVEQHLENSVYGPRDILSASQALETSVKKIKRTATVDVEQPLSTATTSLQRAAQYVSVGSAVTNVAMRYLPTREQLPAAELETYARLSVKNCQELGCWPQTRDQSPFIVPRDMRIALLTRAGVSECLLELEADKLYDPKDAVAEGSSSDDE